MSTLPPLDFKDAIQASDIERFCSLLEEYRGRQEPRPDPAELLELIAACASARRSTTLAPGLTDLEVMYLKVINVAGAGASSPYLTAWWSDRLVNMLLDQGFDAHATFQSDEGEFGVVSLCARACSGVTMERVLRLWVDAGEDGPRALHPVVVACAYLNPEALRYLLGFLIMVPEGMVLEDLTRDAVAAVAAYPERADDLRMLVKHLIGAGVSVTCEPGRPSALAMAFRLGACGAVNVLLDAGCDPGYVDPVLGSSVEFAIDNSSDAKMKEIFHAWRARAEVAKNAAPEKTFDSVLHDPLTVHQRGRSLN